MKVVSFSVVSFSVVSFVFDHNLLFALCIEIVVIKKTGGWWYKGRLGRSRGPCELITLKTAYGAGIIDRDTFIWGEDMDEWAPIHMVYGLEPAMATWEGLHIGEFEISDEILYLKNCNFTT